MGKKSITRRGRKRRPRAASLFVAEKMITGEKSVVSDEQFDAGKVKRKLEITSNAEPCEKKKKYRAITPFRPIHNVIVIPDEEEPENEPRSWLDKILRWFK